MNGPAAGKTIALVQPAWRACGAYRVFAGQIAAWRALGAKIVSLAVSDYPAPRLAQNRLAKRFERATPEFDGFIREFSLAPLGALANSEFLRAALWPFLHGDHAAIRIGLGERSVLSPAIEAMTFDLIHCNHFFCMPTALRLAKGAPIMLETHDVQARQYMVQNKQAHWLKPTAAYDDMLSREIFWMRQADLLLHLNLEEEAFFRNLLPDMRHGLFYPAVPSAPTGPGGEDTIIVASRNHANVESILWFLREVAPLMTCRFRIYGSVEAGVRAKDFALYERYKDVFEGFVENLDCAYANAKLVLAPTVEGTGLAIKTVEALSSGMPLVASPLAFRGMNFDVSALANVVIAQTPEIFAQAANALAAQKTPTQKDRDASPSRKTYEAHFSQHAYQKKLLEWAQSLWAAR